MSIHQKGTWPGRVTDYGIGETKEGQPHVYLVFDVEFPDGVASMTWRGYFTEKAQETAFKALQAVGFNGKINDIIDGPDGGAIKLGTEAKLVCEEEQYEGKTYVRIRWVNSPNGGGSAPQRADAAAAKAKLLQMGIDAAWMKHKQLNPTPAPKPARKPGVDDDIPF